MTSRIKSNRPLSPHLTIYKPQFTSVLSIMHRLTGIGLIASITLIIIWFSALAIGPGAFSFVEILFNLIVIRLLLIFSIWALWYHTLTGIRHLIWDLGYGLDVGWIQPSAYIVLSSSICLTMITLYLGWSIWWRGLRWLLKYSRPMV